MSDITNSSDEVPADYRTLREGQRINLAESIPLKNPLSIYIETTNICNFRCVFCPESFKDYEAKAGGLFQLSPGDFELIANQIEEIGPVETINFYMMGEPFVNKHLIEYIRITKERCLGRKLILTSNGSLLKRERYASLCESGLDYLRISIYGSNDTAHHNNTGSSVKLSLIRNNVADLKAFREKEKHPRPHIYIKMIESDKPEDNVEFLETFLGVGDEVAIEPVMNWNDPEEGNLSGLPPELLQQKGYFSNKKHACPFPFYTLVIHSDLKVSACCVDWDKKVVIGDLRAQTLREIWHGNALRDLQLAHLEKRRQSLPGCRNCTYLHTAPDNLDKLSAQDYRMRIDNTRI